MHEALRHVSPLGEGGYTGSLDGHAGIIVLRPYLIPAKLLPKHSLATEVWGTMPPSISHSNTGTWKRVSTYDGKAREGYKIEGLPVPQE